MKKVEQLLGVFRIAVKFICGVFPRRARGWAVLLVLLAVLIAASPRRTAEALTPTPTPAVAVSITSPQPLQAVQGQVRVLGTTDIPGFRQATLFFGYAQDPTGTWFLIAEKHIPSHEGLIGRWDTTVLTDGDYILRLVVDDRQGQRYEATVPVRVRNYTPIETPTPASQASGGTPQPTLRPSPSPTATPAWPTPTPAPLNPAVLSPDALTRSALYGVGAILGLLALFGLLRRVV